MAGVNLQQNATKEEIKPYIKPGEDPYWIEPWEQNLTDPYLLSWQTVYIPFTMLSPSSTEVDTNRLVQAFQEPKWDKDNPPEIFTMGEDATPHAVKGVVELGAKQTIFAPFSSFSSNTIIAVEDLSASLSSLIETSTSSSTAPTTTSPAGSESSAPADYGQALSSNPPTPTTTMTAATSRVTSTETITTSHCPKELVISDDIYMGSVAGGTIGGVLVGLMICFLAWFCCFRRSRVKAPRTQTEFRTASVTHLKEKPSAFAKETQIFEVPKSVVGWQKHLPQEKDDGTVVRAVKTIYDQVEIHIEGFYRAKAGKLTSQDIELLERFCSDSFSDDLRDLPSALPLLEAIFIRWIVHRISLRSSTRQSFLPSEYSKVPKQNGWHMETDDNDQGHAAESAKGFPQAFTQWRMLTSFLTPSPAENSEYQKQLETKVDYAARPLSEAFAPWSIDGKNVADRDASLRSILVMASEVGLLIFAQPSTFAFDWSSKEGSVTVSPALIKRLDESARPLRSPQVMIDARQLVI